MAGPLVFEPTINVSTLAGVLAAVVLALEGVRQRRQAERKPNLCPPDVTQRLDETVAIASEVLEAVEGLAQSWSDEERGWLRALRDSHAAVDGAGVPRWYSRDQGTAILAALEDDRRARAEDCRRIEGAIGAVSQRLATIEALQTRGKS